MCIETGLCCFLSCLKLEVLRSYTVNVRSGFFWLVIVQFRVRYGADFLNIEQSNGEAWKDDWQINFLSVKRSDRYLSQLGVLKKTLD